MIKCPFCGYGMSDDSHFCSGCGKSIDEIWKKQQEEAQQRALQEQQQRLQAEQQRAQQEQQRLQAEQQRAQQEQRQRLWAEQQRAQQEQQRLWAEQQRAQQEQNAYGAQNQWDAYGTQDEQPKQSKKTLLIILLIAVIAAAGFGGYYVVTHILLPDNGKKTETGAVSGSSEDSGSTQKMVTVMPSATAEPKKTAATPTPTSEPTPAASQSRSTEPELVEIDSVSLSQYTKAKVSGTDASSVVEQDGYDNTPAMLVDGDPTTSWQEGAEGSGAGEWVKLYLSDEYEVKYLTFCMGNWRADLQYRENCRPKDVTIWLDGQSYQVTFPDGQTEFCLEFPEAVSASEIDLRIDSAYEGYKYEDCCISEIGIYCE